MQPKTDIELSSSALSLPFMGELYLKIYQHDMPQGLFQFLWNPIKSHQLSIQDWKSPLIDTQKSFTTFKIVWMLKLSEFPI